MIRTQNKLEKRQYLSQYFSDKGLFMGTVVNRALPSVHGGLLEITLTLGWKYENWVLMKRRYGYEPILL